MYYIYPGVRDLLRHKAGVKLLAQCQKRQVVCVTYGGARLEANSLRTRPGLLRSQVQCTYRVPSVYSVCT